MNNSPMSDLLSGRQYTRKADRVENKTEERTPLLFDISTDTTQENLSWSVVCL